MNRKHLTYERLQIDLLIELARYSLLKGQGGVFALLYAVGIALFVVFLNTPTLVLPWTVAVGVLSFLATRDSLNNRLIMGIILWAFLEKRYQNQEVPDLRLSESLRKGKELFSEIALKILEIEKIHGKNSGLRQVLLDTDSMIHLAHESARQVGEFDRVLSMVSPLGLRELQSIQQRPQNDNALYLRGENIQTVKAKTEEARILVGEIFQQLEILLLQVFQMDKDATDIVRTAEFARSTENMLQKIQGEVDARRLAAQSVVEIITGQKTSKTSSNVG